MNSASSFKLTHFSAVASRASALTFVGGASKLGHILSFIVRDKNEIIFKDPSAGSFQSAVNRYWCDKQPLWYQIQGLALALKPNLSLQNKKLLQRNKSLKRIALSFWQKLFHFTAIVCERNYEAEFSDDMEGTATVIAVSAL